VEAEKVRVLSDGRTVSVSWSWAVESGKERVQTRHIQ
jgi:hypothetical protein